MTPKDYWRECIESSADECEAKLSTEQIDHIAGGIEGAHENYGMAFYSPPSSDRYNEIERQWSGRLAILQAEFDAYRGGAEAAVKRALRQNSDASVSITAQGEVFRHDGRTDQIL